MGAYRTLTQANYLELRHAMIFGVETPTLTPYLDKPGQAGIATIGYGINFETVATNMRAVATFFGFGTTAQDNAFITQLTNATKAATSTANLVSSLNAIMAQAHAANPAVRSSFSLASQQEALDLFDAIAVRYETSLNNSYPGIFDPPTYTAERAVIFSVIWNREAPLVGVQKAEYALGNGDHSAAFVALRYTSNHAYSNPEFDNGIASRRYVESQVFGLSNDPLTIDSAMLILRAGTKFEKTIIDFETKFGGSEITNANAKVGAIAAQTGGSYGTVAKWDAVSKPAEDLLRSQFAVLPLDAVFDLNLVGYVGVLNTIRIQDIWVAPGKDNGTAIQRGGGHNVVETSKANLVDRSAASLDDLIFGNVDKTVLDKGGNDTLLGGGGNDWFVSSVGNDSMDGGAGNDTVTYAKDLAAIDIVLGGTSVSGDILRNIENAVGTNFADRISGDALPNVLIGLNGNDTLRGLGGNDVLIGGAGNDTADGGDQADRIAGGVGNDSLTGGLGNDTIDGGAGDDTIAGGEQPDKLVGGAGNDSLAGGNGNDTLDGGAGNDRQAGGAGNDTYLAVSAGEQVIESVDGGSDSITLATVGNYLLNNIESISLAPAAVSVKIVIDSIDGVISAAQPVNVGITGTAAADRIAVEYNAGGILEAGFIGGGGADTFVFSGTSIYEGSLHFVDFAAGSDKIDVTALDLDGKKVNVTLSIGGQPWEEEPDFYLINGASKISFNGPSGPETRTLNEVFDDNANWFIVKYDGQLVTYEGSLYGAMGANDFFL